VELEQIMRQIERGTWEPPARKEAPPDDLDRDETVRVTAYRWWQRRKTELGGNTRADYKWRLDYVLRHLANDVTAELDARRVDDFRQQLVACGLSPRSVNMVLDLLAQILDDAVEYKLLDANPARGKRRRMRVPKSRRTFLEPDMVVDVLTAAAAWERELPEHQRYGRRAFLATLCLSGPRVSELIESPRGRLDLHAGQLKLGKKTEAGTDRTLELSAFLLDELRPHLAAVPARLREAHGAALPIFRPGPVAASTHPTSATGCSTAPPPGRARSRRRAWSSGSARSAPPRAGCCCPTGSRRTRSVARSRACASSPAATSGGSWASSGMTIRG
jgi:integrase